MRELRVAFVGSRGFRDEKRVRESVKILADLTVNGVAKVVVVSGGASGPDTWAVDEAKRLGIEIKVWPADWARFGASAGPRRNYQIVEDCDEVFAFWDGQSRGTAHTIGVAERAGKPVQIFREEP